MTDRYAVIGQPISHSLSPRIHTLFAQQVGVWLCYEAVEISPDRLHVMLPRLHSEHYLGLNVTLPHKSTVASQCEALSARAQAAGAVNTLIRTPSGWRGDNTDGEGLIRDLDRLQVGIEGRRVLILGAGGATRGIIVPLLARKPKELVISNRTPWRPEELAKAFHGHGPVRPCTHLALKGDRFDLVINATSAGLKGVVPRLPEGVFAAGGTAYDLSYGKAALPFREWAKVHRAAIVSDGLGMLVEQAAAAFELWRGVRPETAGVLASLKATS
jgi:shikimate dehydrogenase